MNLRPAWAVAKADFKERMRRPPVYMAMAVAAFLCYLATTDQAMVVVGNARGVWNSAWSAGTLAVLATSFLTLVGFFVIRNGVQRDEETGAGKLVATSPISSFSYLLGKFISNSAVLLAMMLVFVLASPILQWSRHSGYPFHIWGFLNPFLYGTVPAAAFVSALAVFFECHPWLKRGLGNVLYIVAWTEMLRQSAMDKRGWTDMVGFYSFMNSTHAAAQAQGIKVAENSLNIGHAEFDRWNIFVWDGFAWTWHDLFLRGEWFVVAVALVSLATIFFKRFDPDARPAVRLALPAFLRRASRAERDLRQVGERPCPAHPVARHGRSRTFRRNCQGRVKALAEEHSKIRLRDPSVREPDRLALSGKRRSRCWGARLFMDRAGPDLVADGGTRAGQLCAPLDLQRAPFLSPPIAGRMARRIPHRGGSIARGWDLSVESQPPRAFRGLAIRCGVHCIARPGLRNLVARHTALPGPLSRMVVSGDE